MFKTVNQVRSVVKAIKKHPTLLAIHLSHHPFITEDKQLQAYIRTKLKTFAVQDPPEPPFSTNEVLKDRLAKDWILKDKL